jgi:hypothetical protein
MEALFRIGAAAVCYISRLPSVQALMIGMDDGIYAIATIAFQHHASVIPEEGDFASGYFVLTADDLRTRTA